MDSLWHACGPSAAVDIIHGVVVLIFTCAGCSEANIASNTAGGVIAIIDISRALGRRQNEVSAWPAYFFNHWPVGRPANGANPYTEISSKS